MKRSYTVFNLACLLWISFALGANFWLWKGQIFAASPPVSEALPPTISFQDVKARIASSTSGVPVTTPTTSVSNQPAPSVQTTSSVAQPPLTPPPKEIPKEINLAVPFTSQAPEKKWDQPWQDACEEAAVLMLDAYYNSYKLSVLFAKDEILKMVKWEEDKGWARSIEIEKVQTLTDYYTKKTSHIIENPTVEQIKQYVAAGTPVYVVADGKVLPNPHFRSGGPEYHALIIRGYTETHFITNDPGTQFGENFKYTYDDLMKSIRDWNGGNVKLGKRVVLVIQ